MPSLGIGRLESLGGGKHGSHFGHQILRTEDKKRNREMSSHWITVNKFKRDIRHLDTCRNMGMTFAKTVHFLHTCGNNITAGWAVTATTYTGGGLKDIKSDCVCC